MTSRTRFCAPKPTARPTTPAAASMGPTARPTCSKATTTTTEATEADQPPPVTTPPEPVLVEDEGFPWWLAVLGGLGAVIVSYWLFVTKGDSS